MDKVSAPGEAYNLRYGWGKVDFDMSSVSGTTSESHVFHRFRELSGQTWGGFSAKGVSLRNVQMTRRAYKLLAVLIKSNSEAEVS